MEIKNMLELISHLASKAGVDQENEPLKELLSHADLAKIAIKPELVKEIDEKLLSIEAAKDNHSEIASVYKAQALSALDKRINAILDKSELKDADKDAIKAERNSYAKVDMLIAKFDELRAAQNDQDNDKGKDKDQKVLELQGTIDSLQSELKKKDDALALAKGEWEKEKENIQIERQQERMESKMRAILMPRKTVFDQLDGDVKFTSIMGVINKKLQGLDAELRFDENGDLVPIRKDGSKLYGANHTPITLQSLIDTTMAQEKLDVVTTAGEDTPPAPPKVPGTKEGSQLPGSGNNEAIANFARAQRQALAESEGA